MSPNPHVCSHSFRHASKTIRVTMTDPAIPPDGRGVPMDRGYVVTLPPRRFARPTVTFGVFCPATFSVEGLPYGVDFTIGLVTSTKRPDSSDLGVVSIHVRDETKNPVTREGLESLPLSRLLAAAIHAAGIEVIHYPPNYRGPMLVPDESGELVKVEHTRTEVGPEGHREPLRVRGRAPDPDFHQAVAGVADLRDSGESRLRKVADLVLEARKRGQRSTATKDVAEHFGVSTRQAERLIRQAREAGYLPENSTTKTTTRKATK